jgi:protein-tyrosine-phosphatase
MHAALADPHRLMIVDELALSDRAPGELADRLGIGTNLLAHHVGVLEDAGLVIRLASDGDGRRRYLRLVGADLPVHAPAIRAERVLFVCTHNTARSQLAADLWSGVSDVPAASAGTHPAEAVHPLAVAAASRAGLDLKGARPRPVDAVALGASLVITVCDLAHEELRAAGIAAAVHWSIPDPVRRPTRASFDGTLDAIRARVAALGPHVSRPRPTRSRPGRSHPGRPQRRYRR